MLNQTQLQMRTALRRFCNIQGQTASIRHPDDELNDYLNQALARLRFLLNQALGDQRFLTSATVSTANGTSLYALSSFSPTATDVGFVISVDLTANGTKMWLTDYEPHERAALTDPSSSYSGTPFTYRMRGESIELLPTPAGVYTCTIWYVPNVAQLTTDKGTVVTINRLDTFVMAYAATFVAAKDKNDQLLAMAGQKAAELVDEIQQIGRNRDMNSVARVVDESLSDRWGRRRRHRY